jgi:hypothetical protein
MKKSIASFLLLVCIATAAQAGTRAGAREIQAQGTVKASGNTETDDRTYDFTTTLTLNYFLTPQISVGGSAMSMVMMAVPEEGDSIPLGMLFLLARTDFYLTDGSADVAPYIGARVGMVNFMYEGDDKAESTTTLAGGGQVGFKYFATENTSWNLEGALTVWVPDVEDSESSDVYQYDLALQVGFSYYF